jgi:hypothetical protein
MWWLRCASGAKANMLIRASIITASVIRAGEARPGGPGTWWYAPSGLDAEWLECADAQTRPPIMPIAVLGVLTIIGYGACNLRPVLVALLR